MRYWLTFLLMFWVNSSFSCEIALPNQNVNKNWFTLKNLSKASLVVKAKVMHSTDESNLINFFNQTIKNEYLQIKTIETYKGKSQQNLRIYLNPKICGYREVLNIGEERLFYLSLSSDKYYVSAIGYADSVKFNNEDITFLKDLINGKINPDKVPMYK